MKSLDLPHCCSLLGLPAELRCTIYEYVLVASEHVLVTAQLQQPPLSLVSRQTRSEAITIWYNKNIFAFDIWDCDATLLKAFLLHADATGHGQKNVRIMNKGKKSWTNLKTWCRYVFDDKAFYVRRVHDMSARDAVITAAQDMAVKFSRRIASNNKEAVWSECEEMLDTLRFAVGKLDAEWLD